MEPQSACSVSSFHIQGFHCTPGYNDNIVPFIRRLSSKKRRMLHQNNSTGSDATMSDSSQSPVSSGSPAVCTPSGLDKR